MTAAANITFKSARNPRAEKPITDAALINESQRVNVPYNAHAWDNKGLAPDDIDLLSWFHMHCLDKGFTGNQIGEVLGYDRTNASRILRGTYPVADWSPILHRIRDYRARITPRPTIGGIEKEPAFVLTSAAEMFYQGLDYASRGGFSILAGHSGAGKTKTCDEWDLRNPGRMIRFNAPATGGHVAMIRRLAKKIGVSHRKYSTSDILLTLDNKLTARNLLVIDQGSRLIPSEKQIQAKALEVLMDINEETGCGIVIPLTMRALEKLGDLHYQIEQVTGRAEIFAAKDPTLQHIKDIAAQFGKFTDRTHAALLDLSLQRGSLRNVTKVLNLAHRVAQKHGGIVTDQLIAGAIQNRFERGANIATSPAKKIR